MSEPFEGAAAPRDAATVVVVRAARGAVEILCVERHRGSAFMGGAIVFPGGKVDADDHAAEWAGRTTPLEPRALALAADEHEARAFVVAALRETLEEAAVLPVVGDPAGAADLLELREEMSRDGTPLRSALDSRGWRLDAGRLRALSRWVTPTREPRRFDTRFYLLELPQAQEGAHDAQETTRSFWATPHELLERWRQGEILLAPPTSFTIALFLGAGTVADAVAIARAQPLHAVEPHFVQAGDQTILTLPGDPLHPVPGAPAGCAGSPTRFVFQGPRLVPARAE